MAGQTGKTKGAAGMKAKWSKKVAIIIAIAVIALMSPGYFVMRSAEKKEQPSGKIFLYGELHSVKNIPEKEFELWS